MTDQFKESAAITIRQQQGPLLVLCCVVLCCCACVCWCAVVVWCSGKVTPPGPMISSFLASAAQRVFTPLSTLTLYSAL